MDEMQDRPLLSLADELLHIIAKDTTLAPDDVRNLRLVNKRMATVVDTSGAVCGVRIVTNVDEDDLWEVVRWDNFYRKIHWPTRRWAELAASLTFVGDSPTLTRYFLGKYIRHYRKLKRLRLDCMGCSSLLPLLTINSLHHQPGGITCASTLTSLEFRRFYDVQETPDLGQLPALQSLRYDSCFALEEVPAGLRNLRKLDLNVCMHVDSIDQLTDCSALQDLRINRCPITSLAPLSSCADLTSLALISFNHMGGRHVLDWGLPLILLSGIRTLVLRECSTVQNLQPLTQCGPSLQQLDISGCSRLRSLYPVSGCNQLQKVDASGCERLETLARLPSLTQLSLAGCTRLRSLNWLSGCMQLRTLVLFGCSAVTRLDPLLGPLSNVLEWLNVDGTRFEEAIPPELQACTARGMRPWPQDGPVTAQGSELPRGRLTWEV